MAIYSNNGTDDQPVKNVFNYNGTNDQQVKEVYSNNGTDDQKVWSSQEKVSLSISSQAGGDEWSAWHYSKGWTNEKAFTAVILDELHAGTFIGFCDTDIVRIRNDETTVLKHFSRRYYIKEQVYDPDYSKPYPPEKFDGLQKNDIIKIRMRGYRFNEISTPTTATSSCKLIFTF